MFLPSNITLQFGDSGDFVSELQRRLCLVQCFNETMVNGFYDGNTANGVSRFQGMVGLHVDGVAGPETLRRLNGVISGGGSAPTDKKEEEQKPILGTPIAGLGDMFIGAPPVTDTSILGQRPAEPEMQPQPQQAELAQVQPPQQELPPMQPMHDRQQAQEAAIQQQQGAQQHMLQQQTLANMLLNQTQQPPHAPVHQQQHTPDQQQVHAVAQQQLQPPVQHAQVQQVQQVQQQQQQQQQVQAEQKPAAEPPTRQGIMGRVTQFANAMMQKLADYFEAKLPPATLQEVREIGQTMAASGMKEAAIPTGPDMVRAPQTPARTEGPPQQQQQQNTQRG